MSSLERIYLAEFRGPHELAPLDDFPHDSYDHPSVRKLRRLGRSLLGAAGGECEFRQVMRLAEYVSSALTYSEYEPKLGARDALSIIRLAGAGGTANCTNFAIVLEQLCHAVGILARTLRVTTFHIELGICGHWHDTVEYWDNGLGKWVWVDPRYGMYAKVGKMPLNYGELFRSNHPGPVRFGFCPTFARFAAKNPPFLDMMSRFIRRYGASVITGFRDHFYANTAAVPLRIGLQPGMRPYVTFQGFEFSGGHFFPMADLYLPMNSVKISFLTEGPPKPQISTTVKHYLDNHHKFLIFPKIALRLQNNMPWFREYEVTHGGKTRRTKRGELTLALGQGKNVISVRCVNAWGRLGPESVAVICRDDGYVRPPDYYT